MDENVKDAYQAVADEMDTVCTDTTSDALGVLLASPKFQLLLELFRATYRGKMAVIHRPSLPAATREVWSLHICYICEMLPWVFASDKTNYARYLSVYWCEMMLLPWTSSCQCHA